MLTFFPGPTASFNGGPIKAESLAIRNLFYLKVFDSLILAIARAFSASMSGICFKIRGLDFYVIIKSNLPLKFCTILHLLELCKSLLGEFYFLICRSYCYRGKKSNPQIQNFADSCKILYDFASIGII